MSEALIGFDVWLATALVVFISAAAQSMTGFGFAVLAVPLLVLFWRPVDAVAISMALSTLGVLLMWLRVRGAERVPIVWLLFTASLLGLPFGLWALLHLDLHVTRIIIGVMALATTVVFGIGALRQDTVVETAIPKGSVTLLTGLVAGILTGSLSMPGPPVVMLLTGYRVPKAAYRATLTAFAVLIYPLALAGLVAGHLIGRAAMWQAVLQVPVLALGLWFGNRLHGAASERSFSILSLALLGLTGIVCLVFR